jgi:hypothetical protein
MDKPADKRCVCARTLNKTQPASGVWRRGGVAWRLALWLGRSSFVVACELWLARWLLLVCCDAAHTHWHHAALALKMRDLRDPARTAARSKTPATSPHAPSFGTSLRLPRRGVRWARAAAGCGSRIGQPRRRACWRKQRSVDAASACRS